MLSVPLVVKYFKIVEHLTHAFGGSDKVRNSEVMCAIFLAEATAGHCHDSRFVHHIQAIQKIWLLAL